MNHDKQWVEHLQEKLEKYDRLIRHLCYINGRAELPFNDYKM